MKTYFFSFYYLHSHGTGFSSIKCNVNNEEVKKNSGIIGYKTLIKYSRRVL